MADHPKSYSKVTQRVSNREARNSNQQSPATSSSAAEVEDAKPTASSSNAGKSSREKQHPLAGGIGDDAATAEAAPKSSNQGAAAASRKQQPTSDSKKPSGSAGEGKGKGRAPKKSKAKDTPYDTSHFGNLSSSSSRSSAAFPANLSSRQSELLSSGSEDEELIQLSLFRASLASSDKRLSLRSNPGASLLDGLDFSAKKRKSSGKGKSPANKSPTKGNRSPSPAETQDPAESRGSRKKRNHSGALVSSSPRQPRSSGSIKVKQTASSSAGANAQSLDRGPSTSKGLGKQGASASSSSIVESGKPAGQKPKVEGRKKSAQKRRFSTAVDEATTASAEAEGAEGKRRKKSKSEGAGLQQKLQPPPQQRKSSSKKKSPSSSTLNTGSCASSRRRAASKEGGRLRASNAAVSSTTVTLTTVGAVDSLAAATSSSAALVATNFATSQMSSSGGEDRFFNLENPDGNGGTVDPAGVAGGSNPNTLDSTNPPPGSFTSQLTLDQESDVGRLQALLEARGVPSHLFGALGPRMHQILQRSVLGGSVYKVQMILQNLQSKDENQQLSAAIEMCQLLVMGNEDTLAGFPTRQVVPALINLLKSPGGRGAEEEMTNFNVMHHACRALTYMMEALPRSSAVVVDAVPVFLEKLQSIQCMDVAEQSLQALEMLSRKHHKAILHANGVSSCLTFLDFFSLQAQRTALSITANCCQNLAPDEFHFVRGSLGTLANLLTQQDKKLLESVCLSMSRLVENFQSDESILREVSAEGFLNNVLHLIVATPSLLSSTMFVTVVHMLAVMCSTCPDLAVQLLNLKIADTLCNLLVALNQGASLNIELTPRTPQELYEIVCLIGELMPKLPTDGIFSVDQLLRRNSSPLGDGVAWQWLDDLGVWHLYSRVDCRIIESALQSGEREVNLCIFGVNYTVDFETSQQINEDTGTTRHVRRKAYNSSPAASAQPVTYTTAVTDAREEALKNSPELGDAFIKTLFCVLYEIYNSSAGPSIRHKCLQALMRIIYYGNAEPLKSVLPTCNVSSHIAAMMASTDLKIVVAGIQMAFVLMEKLPDVFNVHFSKEGVMHQIKKLKDLPAPSPAPGTATPSDRGTSSTPHGHEVMDLSTSAAAAHHQQQLQHGSFVAPVNNNHNNASAAVTGGSGRMTRSSGFHQQQLPPGSSRLLLKSHVQPPPHPITTFRPTSFLHVPPHVAPSFALPPPPPYASFPLFHEPAIDFAPPPPMPPSGHPFYPGHVRAATEGIAPPPPTVRSTSPVSRFNKMSNVLKHKKAPTRRSSGGKSGRALGGFGGPPAPMAPMPSLGPASSSSSNLLMPTGDPLSQHHHHHPQQHLVQGFQTVDYYNPAVVSNFQQHHQQQQQQPQVPSELHNLLGEVELPASTRSSKWGGSSRSSYFLGNLRWNRTGGSGRHLDRPASPLPQGSLGHPVPHPPGHHQIFYQTPMPIFAMPSGGAVATPPTAAAATASLNDVKERVRMWISEQAKKFCEKYCDQGASSSSSQSALNQLCSACSLLLDEAKSTEGLQELSRIMAEEDVSPFEMIHSNVLDTLLAFFTPTIRTHSSSGKGAKAVPEPAGSSGGSVKPNVTEADVLLRYERAKTFLTVFLRSPNVAERESILLNTDAMDTRPFQSIVMKLMACFHHLEQFQVKVHDFSTGSSSTRGGNSALRFFDTHQIKCDLQRHPSCTTLKPWRGGPVKIDPLALVQAIERYLLLRGYARVRQGGEDDDDDDDDDDPSDEDDIEEGLSVPSTSYQHHHRRGQQALQSSQQQAQHSIEFVLNDHVLPYSMTVYEAVRQFGGTPANPSRVGGAPGHESEPEMEWEGTFGANCIWTNTHTIYYRPVTESQSSSVTSVASGSVTEVSGSPKKTKVDKSKNKSSNWKSVKELELGRCANLDRALDPQTNLMTFKDPSLQVLPLLSIMHALNRNWGVLFEKMNVQPLLGSQDFLSSKLTSKANRQLQDPLSIMTGNLPAWLSQIARTCSFLLPFETRQLLFYATTFDRDRAMHRVQRESNQDQGSSSETNDRVVPRLERKKATVSRDDILKQAEKLIGDMSNYKALLEIQYENEVGTGLGPTMEFYALVSRELQRHDLELWSGEPVSASEPEGPTKKSSSSQQQQQQQQRGNKKQSTSAEDHTPPPQQQQANRYTFSPCGLFPSPLSKSVKAAQVNKIKSKFKFLGKFMAKALMDSRMLDLPLSKALYKWMLNASKSSSSAVGGGGGSGSPQQQGSSLGLVDLENVLPTVSTFVQQLLDVVRQKKRIETDPSHTHESRLLALNSLTVDGCSFDDLGVDFCLPGFPNIEMKKGGKDVLLSLSNIEEYLKLVVHWLLHEGPGKQLEAFKEGFESIFPLSLLSLFYPEEMELLFCGNNFEPWTPRFLTDCCRADHGYTMESQPIRFLFDVLSSFTAEEQRLFIQFTTGSPRLPVGGLKSLNPPLTIVRKSVDPGDDPDNYLPSVMTCVNYFKLPEYTSFEVTKEKLLLASREGQNSFHLS